MDVLDTFRHTAKALNLEISCIKIWFEFFKRLFRPSISKQNPISRIRTFSPRPSQPDPRKSPPSRILRSLQILQTPAISSLQHLQQMLSPHGPPLYVHEPLRQPRQHLLLRPRPLHRLSSLPPHLPQPQPSHCISPKRFLLSQFPEALVPGVSVSQWDVCNVGVLYSVKGVDEY